jgi:surface protein
MFRGCGNFNQPLHKWDVSRVRDMSHMFHGASSFNAPIDSWDVSRATTMSCTFLDAAEFNQPLWNWDVSSVRDMSHMFHGASSFNQQLPWDVGQVVSFSSMFMFCDALNVEFDWDARDAVHMGEMFGFATAMNRDVYIRTGLALESTCAMFIGATSFNSRLSLTDTGNVTNMSVMFAGATDFRQVVWLDMSSVRDISGMFDDCPDEAMVQAMTTETAKIRRQLGSRLRGNAPRTRTRRWAG